MYRVKAGITVAIALFAVVFGISKCHAETDPPGPEQIQNLYMLAVGHAGIGVPEKAPKVYRISEAALCGVVGQDANCGMKGMQVADAVFYSDQLDFTQALDSSILLHEFVHYLQYEQPKYNAAKNTWSKAGRVKTPLEYDMRECQAYKVQREVLGKLNINFSIPDKVCHE